MSEFRDSEEKRLRALLNQAELEDQHPACFLRCMRELAEGKVRRSVKIVMDTTSIDKHARY